MTILATNNIIVVRTEDELPDVLDQYQIYNILYNIQPFGAGFYGVGFDGNLSLLTPSNQFVRAGYGGLRLVTPVLSTIGAGWTTLPFDTTILFSPKNVLQSTVNDSLAPQVSGVWMAFVNATISFSDANSGRTFEMRVTNITDGISTPGAPIFVGRNQDGINITRQFLFEIGAPEEGDEYVMEIGNTTDTFSGVQIEYLEFDMTSVSEVR